MLRLADLGVVALRSCRSTVEHGVQFRRNREQETALMELYEELPWRGEIQEGCAEFAGEGFGKNLLQDFGIGRQPFDRCVQRELPLMGAAVVAQPANRVFVDPIHWMTDRNDAPFTPVIETPAGIEDVIVGQSPGQGSNGHVAGAQIGEDALLDGGRRVRAAEGRDFDPLSTDLEGQRSPIEIGRCRWHPDAVLTQNLGAGFGIQSPGQVQILALR